MLTRDLNYVAANILTQDASQYNLEKNLDLTLSFLTINLLLRG